MAKTPLSRAECEAAMKAGKFDLPLSNTAVMWAVDVDRQLAVTYSFRDDTYRIARRYPTGRMAYWELQP